MRIVVMGGTGLIGAKLVRKLDDSGHEALSAAPATGVNTVTGEGLADVLRGADVVVDVTNARAMEDRAATSFFRASTRNLLAAGAVAGVGHHVVLSVVGTERLSESVYFRAKAVQEELVRQSPLPYTIVRATQFFEFVGVIADHATEDATVRLPPVLVQPMAADDVACSLGQFAAGKPLNDEVEIAGPEQFRLDELVRLTLESRLDHRDVVGDSQARYFGALVDERTLLPEGWANRAGTRLQDWLGAPLVSKW